MSEERSVFATVEKLVLTKIQEAVDRTRIECHRNFEGVAEEMVKEAAKAFAPAITLLEKMEEYYERLNGAAGCSACLNCDMGAAGPGPEGRHDPNCLFVESHAALMAIRALHLDSTRKSDEA